MRLVPLERERERSQGSGKEKEEGRSCPHPKTATSKSRPVDLSFRPSSPDRIEFSADPFVICGHLRTKRVFRGNDIFLFKRLNELTQYVSGRASRTGAPARLNGGPIQSEAIPLITRGAGKERDRIDACWRTR